MQKTLSAEEAENKAAIARLYNVLKDLAMPQLKLYAFDEKSHKVSVKVNPKKGTPVGVQARRAWGAEKMAIKNRKRAGIDCLSSQPPKDIFVDSAIMLSRLHNQEILDKERAGAISGLRNKTSLPKDITAAAAA